MNKQDKQIQEEGMLPDDPDDPLFNVICPECKGSGEESIGIYVTKCFKCGGKGRIKEKVYKRLRRLNDGKD